MNSNERQPDPPNQARPYTSAKRGFVTPSPEPRRAEWFNTSEQPILAALRGRVATVWAFRMLNLGCVSQIQPQAQLAAELMIQIDERQVPFAWDQTTVSGVYTLDGCA